MVVVHAEDPSRCTQGGHSKCMHSQHIGKPIVDVYVPEITEWKAYLAPVQHAYCGVGRGKVC